MWHIHFIISPRLAPEWSWILVKISHITMDFVISPASDRIILGLVPQLFITWIWMRPTGVRMVSMDQDDAFRGQHLLQLGTISGYSNWLRRESCSRAVCCAARLEGTDSFTTDHFHPMIVEESFRLLNRLIQHHAAYLLQNLPQISSRMVMNSDQN